MTPDLPPEPPLSAEPPAPGDPPSVPPPSPDTAGIAEPEPPPPPPAPPPPPSREPFWGYSDVLLFAGLAVPCMLTGYGVVHGLLALFHIHFAVRAAELLAEQLAGYALLFLALRAIFRLQYGRPFWRSLGWTEMHAPFLWLVVAGCAAAVAVAFSTYFIRVPNTPNPMTELLHDRASIALLAIFGCTLGPLCEELVFRGFLQPLLVRSFGAVAGILLAALPFGLLHIPEYGNSWRHGVVIALAGAAFGWIRHVTGSTKAATVMHASYNALFFFVLLSQGKDLPLK